MGSHLSQYYFIVMTSFLENRKLVMIFGRLIRIQKRTKPNLFSNAARASSLTQMAHIPNLKPEVSVAVEKKYYGSGSNATPGV